MTNKDFEMIAGILASAESKIEADTDGSEITDSPTDYALHVLNHIVTNFSDEISKQHPRFNAGRFEVLARPIWNSRLKARILASFAQKG